MHAMRKSEYEILMTWEVYNSFTSLDYNEDFCTGL